jgi:iron complex transport system substrate-binding protein
MSILRKSGWSGVLLALVVVLAGCGPISATGVAPTPVVSVATAVPATEEASAFPVTVTDGLGNEVTIESRPEKIVSLTLGTDETLLDLVGPERLIGVTYLASDETTSNIAGRPELAEVSNIVEADAEQILALQPDLVFVGSFTDSAVLDQLKNAGVKLFVVGNFTSIEAMKENILTIGKAVGEDAKAQEMAADMDASLKLVADKLQGASGEKPTVLYYTSDGWVAGSETTVDDIIIKAGGVNAAADQTGWNQLSPEAIIELDPDVVILSPYVTEDEFAKNPAYATLKAVTNNRFVALTDAHMSATSQYIVLAVEDMVKVLYPDLK